MESQPGTVLWQFHTRPIKLLAQMQSPRGIQCWARTMKAQIVSLDRQRRLQNVHRM